jgi:hypothetical protein
MEMGSFTVPEEYKMNAGWENGSSLNDNFVPEPLDKKEAHVVPLVIDPLLTTIGQ